MAEDGKTEQTDPITAMAVEVDALRKEVAQSKKLLEDSNKAMVQMMNTNKNLVAEINAIKSVAQPAPKGKSGDEIALESMKKTLNIK